MSKNDAELSSSEIEKLNKVLSDKSWKPEGYENSLSDVTSSPTPQMVFDQSKRELIEKIKFSLNAKLDIEAALQAKALKLALENFDKNLIEEVKRKREHLEQVVKQRHNLSADIEIVSARIKKLEIELDEKKQKLAALESAIIEANKRNEDLTA